MHFYHFVVVLPVIYQKTASKILAVFFCLKLLLHEYSTFASLQLITVFTLIKLSKLLATLGGRHA